MGCCVLQHLGHELNVQGTGPRLAIQWMLASCIQTVTQVFPKEQSTLIGHSSFDFDPGR